MNRQECRVRVPDHTDFTDCGDTVLRGGLCAFHLREEVYALQVAIKRSEERIALARKRLDELQTESG